MILNENICDSATFWITVYIYICIMYRNTKTLLLERERKIQKTKEKTLSN